VALQFLCNAMAPQADERFPFGGRPASLYADNGPVTRSHVFQQGMDYLGIEVQTHLPRGHDGRRTPARSKGKVERPFRTVKEAHETLYHFHAVVPTSTRDFFFLIRYTKRLPCIDGLALDDGGPHDVATAHTAQRLFRPLPEPATRDGVACARPG
jgi:hypothetical protein